MVIGGDKVEEYTYNYLNVSGPKGDYYGWKVSKTSKVKRSAIVFGCQSIEFCWAISLKLFTKMGYNATKIVTRWFNMHPSATDRIFF